MPPKQNKQKQRGKQTNAAKSKSMQLVSIPAAVSSGTVRRKEPRLKYAQDGSCYIAHTEYIGDIDFAVGNTLYTSQYICNPAKSDVFPWLSSIANRYEMYRFEKLKFSYNPSCGTGNGGYVALGFDFDYYDTTPTKQAMMNWKYSAKGATWTPQSLDVSSDSRLATYRYTNENLSSGDKRLDYLGNLWCIREAVSAGYSGDLMVEYVVHFRQPAMNSNTAESLVYTNSSAWSGSSSYELFKNIATGAVGNIACEQVAGTNYKLLIKEAGKFLVEAYANGVIGGNFVPAVSIPTGSDGEGTWTTEKIFNSSSDASAVGVLNILKAPLVLEMPGPAYTSVASSCFRLASILA